MKNRTIAGAICIAVALTITFILTPLVTRLSSDNINVPRVKNDIKQGAEIMEDDIEIVTVKKGTLPNNIIVNTIDIIGKYSSCQIFQGDYFTEGKLSGESKNANDIFQTLNGSKMAISITIESFAKGLSGKLENGDIVSLLVTNKNTNTTSIPPELRYVQVITTTTAGGVDKDSVIENEDGSYDLPTTITLLVSSEQARLISQYEETSIIHVALVYRGDAEKSNQFIAAQDEYLAEAKENEEVKGETSNDISEANDIINDESWEEYYG